MTPGFAPRSSSTRYLAIDLGDKRTGIAVGDLVTGSSPIGVVETPIAHDSGEALLRDLLHAIDEHLDPSGELVFGLPLNMDGTEGPRARTVRLFAARLADRSGRKVHLQDERLTSAEADWAMAGSGLTHAQKKRLRDALAAAAILRDFLAALDRAAPTDPDGAPDDA
ncbi:MAG: Holliday junction resolvase RuvX [Phycisphaerales bacterium]|nr:Holliday junction resolvase RuvX [Phycisphaerales bacterium]